MHHIAEFHIHILYLLNSKSLSRPKEVECQRQHCNVTLALSYDSEAPEQVKALQGLEEAVNGVGAELLTIDAKRGLRDDVHSRRRRQLHPPTSRLRDTAPYYLVVV